MTGGARRNPKCRERARRLRGGLLTCPLHGAQFDVRTGAHQGPPAFAPIICYPVTEADGATWVELD